MIKIQNILHILFLVCCISNTTIYSQNKLTVKVYTGDIKGAGTNSDISIEIDNSEKFILNPFISGNAFEKGDVDIIKLPGEGISEDIETLTVSHNNKGIGSDWFLDKIELTTGVGNFYTFECNCWISGIRKRLVRKDYSKNNGLPPRKIVDRNLFFKSALGSNKYLDVSFGSTKNGTPLQIMSYNGSKAQQFNLEYTGVRNQYYIKSALGENIYVNVFGKASLKDRVVISESKSLDGALWILEKLANGNFLIKSKYGKYLDVKWGNSADGTPVWMWTKNSGAAQQWNLKHIFKGNLVPYIGI